MYGGVHRNMSTVDSLNNGHFGLSFIWRMSFIGVLYSRCVLLGVSVNGVSTVHVYNTFSILHSLSLLSLSLSLVYTCT